MKQEKYVAYVGTYTHENSVGIHIYDVDVEAGKLTERKVVPINNPSDLVVSKDRRFLYSIADEGVESFRIEKDGDLTPINKQWIGGMRGCYVEVDDGNRYLFVGGHHDGRVSMMHLGDRGRYFPQRNRKKHCTAQLRTACGLREADAGPEVSVCG